MKILRNAPSLRTRGQLPARDQSYRVACALVDAGHGFGHFSTSFALEWAMRRAPIDGLAAVTIRDSHHIGRLGEYTERAVTSGFLAVITVGSAGPGKRWTRPFGGRTGFLGTNPWSLGAPGLSRDYVYDAATTTVAEGKVQVAASRGVRLPPGCIVDDEGRPTTNPEDLYANGHMVPLGDVVAGHKGFGLGLGAALFGALSMAADDGVPPVEGSAGGVWLFILDPAAFGSARRYRQVVDSNLAALERVPPVDSGSNVLRPGQPEQLSRVERGSAIPLSNGVWQDLLSVGRRLKVAPPILATAGP
ncbi:MAG: Ldh family oxidoreductase [Candidatus Dormibacteraceae bacterium]